MARRKVDTANEELTRILEELLQRDEDITARAVVREHSSLANPSAISRNEERRQLVEQFQQRQKEMRRWQGRLKKQQRDKAAADLTQRDTRITELEGQLTALTDSHVAMIAAVGELGGMGKLMKFYDHYRDVRDKLHTMGALPTAEVKPHKPRTGRKP